MTNWFGRGLACLVAASGFQLGARPAAAADPAIHHTVVVREGVTNVPGVGLVTLLRASTVNDAGDTWVVCDTDHPNTAADEVVLRNGVLAFREGQPLASPPGYKFRGFPYYVVRANDAGSVGWVVGLEDGSGTLIAGVCIDDVLVLPQGAPATAPGFPPGAVLDGVTWAFMNDSNEFLVMATFSDPSQPGVSRDCVLRLDAQGNQTLLVKEGDPVPGAPGYVMSGLPFGFQGDLNDAGDALYVIHADGPGGEPASFLMKDQTPISQSGSPAPVPGATWYGFGGAEYSLNNDGDVAFKGATDPGDELIVRNGVPFHAYGDVLEVTAPDPIQFFNFAPMPLPLSDRGHPDDEGDILWRADWNAQKEAALLLEEKPLVIEDVDSFGGSKAFGVGTRFHLSDNGRYVVVECSFALQQQGVVLLDLGDWQKQGRAKAGSTKPKLRGFGRFGSAERVTLRLSNAVPNSVANLIIGLSPVDAPFFGGTLVPSPDLVLTGLPTNAFGTLELHTQLPVGIPPGTQFWFQFWNQDPGGSGGLAASNCISAVAQ